MAHSDLLLVTPSVQKSVSLACVFTLQTKYHSMYRMILLVEIQI